MPSRSARLAAATKASRTRARPCASSASGGASPSLCGTADGAFRLPAALGERDLLAAIPRPVARSLAAGMGELHRDRDLRMLAHRGQDRLQRRFGGVVPQAEAARRDAADRLHMGGLDAEHRRARQRERVDVGEMPVIGLAVFGRILAHRRHHDAIGKRKAAQLIGENRALMRGFPDGRKQRGIQSSETPRVPQPAEAATRP